MWSRCSTWGRESPPSLSPDTKTFSNIKLSSQSIRQTRSLVFSLAALKLLAFFRDLLKLRILFNMGSGRTFESRGESEGTGVRVLSWLGEAGTGGGGLGVTLLQSHHLTAGHHITLNLPNWWTIWRQECSWWGSTWRGGWFRSFHFLFLERTD